MERIKHLMSLSKLNLTEEEEKEFASEFDKILTFVGEITTLELSSEFDKDKAVGLSALREDEPEESLPREAALKNAPKQKDGCFVTPLVIE